MAAEPFIIDDRLENLVRKCIVFPADGSETHIAHMAVRTLTVGDVLPLVSYSRCVDMASTYGDEYRKTRVMAHKCARDGIQNTYHFFYNLSPKLPINLNVARIIAVTPSDLKAGGRLFWRGDVVAMKVQPESEEIVESLDADLLDLNSLEEIFRERYQEGSLEYLLHSEENLWKRLYAADYSLLFPTFRRSATESAEKALHDLNELRRVTGRPPLPRPFFMKSYTELAFTLYATIKSALCLHQNVTGPPKLPLDLERRIFEMCALESPDCCTVLVLVAKRVNEWIDPILIATVYIEDSDFSELEHFHAKLNNDKPFEYYAQHIKNLSIFAAIQEEKVKNILAICTGVENLVLWQDIDFFVNPNFGRNLRRLTINLEWCFRRFRSSPNFCHPCFANLTHLHLYEDTKGWSTHPGWETLSNLTHLAFACSGSPEITTQVIQKLPAIRYVAFGYYHWDKSRKYTNVEVHNSPDSMDVRVVVLWGIPAYDWVRGARGEGDFWDLVEQEVERRLEKGLVD